MKRTHYLIFLVLMAFLLPVGSVFSSESACDWKLQVENEGVKTYYRCRENSPITQFRSIAVLDFPLEVLMEVVIDVPSYPKWMPDVAEATVLKEFHRGMERGNFYIHLMYDSLWPVNDRDVVIESIPRTDWNRGVSVLKLKKLNKYPFSPKKNVVRIRDLESEFKFEYLERNKTKVTFTTFVDVGGKISPKLAKVQAESVPHQTLEGMAKIATDKKYFEAAARDYY